MKRNNTTMRYLIVCFTILFTHITFLSAQEEQVPRNKLENLTAKGSVTNENEIKLRWAPANPKAWADGLKFGYTIERFTMSIDGVWSTPPLKKILGEHIKPESLNSWETIANTSDYAAVIAQAFYGEDFNLSSSSSDMASIINQAEELQQRFSTSVFMAEYDYDAAKMAGWAFTDNTVKKNEQYLYRLILDRPNKVEGDTAVVFINSANIQSLPKPYGLNAVFGDKSVMLSWDYVLLSSTYHSYHIEKMSSNDGVFSQITELPVTSLDEKMDEIFFTDSLSNNEDIYTYRIKGVTSFGEIGPVSETINGHGIKIAKCIPQIYSGTFQTENMAQIYWEFNCDDESLVNNFRLDRSSSIDGDYETIADNLSVNLREYSFGLRDNENYVKLLAINKDKTKQESFPFLLRKIDSIPPAIPTGLKAVVDSLGVAHISWNPNTEPDLRGYRLLRSFAKGEEKSSFVSDFIAGTEYSDSLSLNLNNPKVYYTLTALDNRYNESEPCDEIAVNKPTIATPADPVIIGYQIEGNKVSISWITDRKRDDINYTLIRSKESDNTSEVIIFSGDSNTNSFVDEISETAYYTYRLIAKYPNGRKSTSPQPLNIHLIVDNDLNQVSGFSSYVDRDRSYIELTWRKNDKAAIYRIYKSEGDNKMFLWNELNGTESRIVDELVVPATDYTYTILFVTPEGRSSKARSLIVNY